MSIAEKLRNIDENEALCLGDYISIAITGKHTPCEDSCAKCRREWANRLADAIEAEQTETRLPDGVIWPTYEDGELVTVGDVVDTERASSTVGSIEFTNEGGWVHFTCGWCCDFKAVRSHKRASREVLDADGVPIKVGDTVWYEIAKKPLFVNCIDPSGSLDLTYEMGGWGGYGCVPPDKVTHRKPDTQEDIDADCGMEAYNYLKKRGICPPKSDYESQKAWKRDCRRLQRLDLLDRQRKLLGGGQ